ncbi:HU family DNA-binding protein [Streptomyces beihaiensis]|uniref:HU family DNA-binding protein n=1 Tax=Streptomyces beihaiensis TaxID=2984495 RepID=A0ABT3TSV8_9ACTN|nr:HU family DNA-binding protein [Streptomyces beihaiensis]MCX3059596.1 HU family DNA-binding protein [Streptomyces beihaiensis]
MKKKPTPVKNRLNTTQLIAVVAADLGTDPAAVRDTVMATFDAIARANASGHDVAITNFVTFISHRVKRTKRRNPQTGDTFTAPAHQVVRVRVSPTLADAVRRRDRKVTIRKAPKGARTPAE